MQTTDLPLCVNRLHSTCAGLIGWSQPCSIPLRIAFFTMINLSIGSCRTDNPFERNWCKKSSTMLNFLQMTALLLLFAASAKVEREAMMMTAIGIFILRCVAMSCDLWWDRWAILFTSSIKILYVFNDTLSPSFMVPHFLLFLEMLSITPRGLSSEGTRVSFAPLHSRWRFYSWKLGLRISRSYFKTFQFGIAISKFWMIKNRSS